MADTAIFSELSDWSEYSKIFIAVLALVSPPVIVPLFLGVMGDSTRADKIAAARVGAAGFAVVTILLTFFGQDALALFGISIGAFKFVGGILTMLLAADMMRTENFAAVAPRREAGAGWLSIGVVPLTIPILAGPGAISATVIFASEHNTIAHKVLMTAVLLGISAYIAVMLTIAAGRERLFGPVFTVVVNRILGLIVLAVAIEFIMDGISEHFPILKTVHQSAGS